MSDALVLEVIRKTVTVDCAVEEAFRVFTADAISWWPVETHSIHATVDEIVFEPKVGGAVYEIGTNGERGHWATVLEWEPPHRLVLAWNILEREGDLTEVEVRFLPEGIATRVELEHRGWENVELDGPAKRGNYDTGWEAVLGKYVERA
ncbi:MAG TPA: SRPBCC family protein [Gaiellaceae bacterium]|nr:SRPBCC family protein [Gaiellaceae bacterium]